MVSPIAIEIHVDLPYAEIHGPIMFHTATVSHKRWDCTVHP